MSRIVVCLDCPHYMKGGYCAKRHKDVSALQEACEKAHEPAGARDRSEELSETPAPLPATKKCRKCGQDLPLSDFEWTKTRNGERIRMRMCSECYHESMSKNGKKPKQQPETMTTTETPQTKRCSSCGEIKPVAEFYKDDNASDGLKSHCKACHRAKVNSRQKERREAAKAERADELTTTTKVCPKCGRELPKEAFGRHAKTRDGLQPMCRECKGAILHGNRQQTPQTAEGVKVCSKCGETKPTTDFYRDSKSPDGLQYWCKSCSSKNNAAHKEAKSEPIRVAVRETLTDEQMVAALRARGWEVTCTRTITQTL